jgi:hypothetical protein
MTSARKLLLQGAFVVSMGAVAMLMPPKASAAALNCYENYCLASCDEFPFDCQVCDRPFNCGFDNDPNSNCYGQYIGGCDHDT